MPKKKKSKKIKPKKKQMFKQLVIKIYHIINLIMNHIK